MDALTIPVPVRGELVTKETIDQAYLFYYELAEAAVKDMVFKGLEERDAEIARTILQLVEATDTITDNVRQRAIAVIARYQLYHHTPEGWSDLRSMIHDACPNLSPPELCEHLAVADTIAPFCETHDIKLEMPPNKLGYLREAASALRNVIQSPLPNGEKAQVVQKELNWLFNEALSRDGPGGVRDRYRSWRGVPARGITGEHNGKEVIVLMATPDTAAILRQRLSRVVNWDLPGTLTVREGSGARVPSRLGNGQLVQDQTVVISLSHTVVIDGKTGEVVENG